MEEVHVEALREDTYFAVAKLRVGNTVQEVDARPSDALALAVRVGAPIYVDDEVISRAGRVVDDDTSHLDGAGIDEIAAQMDEAMKESAARKLPSTEDVERATREVLGEAFGAEPDPPD